MLNCLLACFLPERDVASYKRGWSYKYVACAPRAYQFMSLPRAEDTGDEKLYIETKDVQSF